MKTTSRKLVDIYWMISIFLYAQPYGPLEYLQHMLMIRLTVHYDFLYLLLSTINSDLFFLIWHVWDNFLELFFKYIELVKENFQGFFKTIASVMFGFGWLLLVDTSSLQRRLTKCRPESQTLNLKFIMVYYLQNFQMQIQSAFSWSNNSVLFFVDQFLPSYFCFILNIDTISSSPPTITNYNFLIALPKCL